MGLRSKLIDIMTSVICGSARLQTRKEKTWQKKLRINEERHLRTQQQHSDDAWPRSRRYEQLQEGTPPAKIGLGLRSTARQWGQATGELLDECSAKVVLRAKQEPARQIAKQLRTRPVPSSEPMGVTTVCQIIAAVGKLLDDLPYLICGQSAMVYYGSEIHHPSHVSILVPQASKDIVRHWLMAQGMHRVHGRSDCFAVPSRDGIPRCVRVKLIKDSSFEGMEIMRAGKSRAKLITLPSLANQVAGAYVADLKSPRSSEQRQKAYARDMLWILERIADVRLDEHWLMPWRANQLRKAEFWLPFSISFPETVLWFAYAGLHVNEHGELNEDGSFEAQISRIRGGNLVGGLFID